MISRVKVESDPPYIPVEVVRWLLEHRRRRLAAEARQIQSASGSVSQAGPLADDTTPPQEGTEHIKDTLR